MRKFDLNSTDEVIEAVGGPMAAAKLTGRTSQHVWNWKNDGRFPSNTYLVFQTELERLKKTAPPALWGMATPEQVGS